MRSILTLTLALLVSGCTGNKVTELSAEPVRIAPKTWDAYQKYLAVIGSTGHGVFAVVSDGNGGSSWVCETAICSDNGQFATKAIKRCETINPGYSCIVFAVNRDPVIPFEAP